MSTTVDDVQERADEEAGLLMAEATDFVNLLRDDSEVDFSIIGDVPSVGFGSWDYGTELATLIGFKPGYITGLTDDGRIDAMDGLDVPDAPEFTIPVAAIPTLDAERPVVVMPTLPSTTLPDAPSDAPAVLEAAIPDAPLVTLPTVPTFEEFQIPPAPTFNIPSFTAEAPVNNLVAPTDQFGYVDAGYTSSLRDPLVAKLLFDMTYGGYGIEANDETLLWTRARDRAEVAGRAAVEAANKRAAATAFPMPSGAYYADLQQAKQEMLKALGDVNREIALKRADIYVENRRFTITQVQEYEKIAISLYNATQERALNTAKATVELGIARFDAAVRNFNAQLEAYRTTATVFETRIRAELGKAEIYKTQIDAERLRGEFNKVRAELYQAQLNGIQTTVNLYKTRLEAVNVFAQIQAQKIDIFKSRVEAYATRVRAKAAEFDMYRAAVDGQVARVDIYKTDIAAYEARIRGEEARIRAITTGNDSLNVTFNARVAAYRAALDGRKSALDGQLELQRLGVSGTGVNVAAYRALSDAILQGQNLHVEGQKLTNDWNKNALNSQVRQVEFRLEQLKATMLNRAEIDKYGAKFYGDQLTALRAAVAGLATAAE